MACSASSEWDSFEIDLAAIKVSKLEPAPANFYGSDPGVPINEAFEALLKCEVSNESAAKLVLNNGLKKESHEACVKVINENGKKRIQGSGILFKTSDTGVMLVTAAHIITSVEGNVKIMLEFYEDSKNENKVRVRRKKIGIPSHSTEIAKEADMAKLALSDDDSKYILEKIRDFPLPSLALDDRSSEKFMMIHYNDDGYKQVSIGEREGIQENRQPLKTRIHIQAGEGASGAPVFNFQGDVVAILRSHDKSHPMIRYCTSVNPLHHNQLHDALQEPFEAAEGDKFDKLKLRNQKELSRRGIHENVEAAAIDLTVLQCLGVGGKHGHTRMHSFLGVINSDHFPAYGALKQGNVQVITGRTGKGRVGENLLPAITIPEVIHLEMETTGNKKERQVFRAKQAELIATGRVSDAIIMNFDDYHKKGLFKQSNYKCTPRAFNELMANYHRGFVDALKVHEDLGFINKKERIRLEGYILALTKQNGNDSQSLEEGKKIVLKKIEDYQSGN